MLVGAFELDVKAGDLRQGDRTIRLQKKPCQVLLILVEYGGEVVSREEIQKRLWPNDTAVDFEHGINTAIKKLRAAFGDSADGPRYIETLARRGYRLMVPVEWVDAAENRPSAVDEPALKLHQELQPSPQVENPALRRTVPALPESSALIGRKVSHYRVLAVIGGGGMGVVYRAEDVKLGRAVALKFLPEELGGDPKALERFEREARAASALDHPNICSIYEFGEHKGQPFLAMQLLEGQTLRDRLTVAREAGDGGQALPLGELLDIAIQIARGLEAAHEKGIVHRDIKPANIFITSKGVAKILDFGVAKLTRVGDDAAETLSLLPSAPGRSIAPGSAGDGESGNAAVASPATIERTLTRTGIALGTAGYMSPEQVRGERLDARTDLFSFGLVLYEMATGQRAFSGETAAVLHDAILHQTPIAVHDLNSTLPPGLARIVNKAIEKDREQRYQSAVEILADFGKAIPPTRLPGGLRRWKLLAAGLALAAILVFGWHRFFSAPTQGKFRANDTVVLADFANATNDSVFDGSLNLPLAIELEQSSYINVLSANKVHNTLKQMNQEGAKLTPQLAHEICRSTNSEAVVEGSVADAGSHYRIELKAMDCQSGQAIAVADAEAGERNDVVKMVGVAGYRLRGRMGEPNSSLAQFNQPVEETLTSSPEALQAFAQAMQVRGGHHPDTISQMKRVLELDPNFVPAYAQLGFSYANLGQTTLSIQNFRKWYELRGRQTKNLQLQAEAVYCLHVTGELEKAIASYRRWGQAQPAYIGLMHNQIGLIFNLLGQYEKSATEEREALRLLPDTVAPTVNLMVAYMALNRPQEALSVFDEVRARNLDDGQLRWMRYRLAFMQGDRAAMKQQVAWAMGKLRTEDWLLAEEAASAAYDGHFHTAREFSQRALGSARNAGGEETAAGWEARQALMEAEAGNAKRAPEMASVALGASPGRIVETAAALALARSGQPEQAQSLVTQLDREFPADTIVQGYCLPVIRAAIQLQNHNPQKAIAILEVARPYELGIASQDFAVFGNLWPVYLRGLAYLDSGQAQNAAAEFQKMIDHPGIVLNFVTGALAHLQLGRAQAMSGNKAAARKSYKDFLALWKDADSDLPIYQQAQAEYAKLQKFKP